VPAPEGSARREREASPDSPSEVAKGMQAVAIGGRDRDVRGGRRSVEQRQNVPVVRAGSTIDHVEIDTPDGVAAA